MQELQEEEQKFQIQIHGGTVKETNKIPETSNTIEKQKMPLFGDPVAYENLSSNERQSMTEKMIKRHKSTKFL